ncbi:cupin domain-containing protein [Aestuariibius sp. 2305UL40-4]|uniref:cupin domain-containing protein n=1 Tax=Aestuariibius violaceus TaxID=3234132 RepID=UPI00345EFF61
MIVLRAAILAGLLAGGAMAQGVETRTLDAMALNAHPSFDGVSAAFVTGAFDADGLYAANSVMQEGAVFPPHSHPDERLSLVVDGVMFLGTGETIDPATEIRIEAGSLVLTPAGTVHYMIAREGDVRILEIGSGPSGTAFPG